MRTAALLLALLAVATPAVADRGAFTIADFHVDLTIRPDATVEVVERLAVDFSAPRHGIYRSIPIRYTDPKGFQYSLGFDFRDVTDDRGGSYQSQVKHQGAYVNIRIGSPSFTVEGRRVYVIRYTLDDALRHFGDHDELYWNVTGNEWNTTIARASARVRLPGPVDEDALGALAWTGVYGSTGQNARIFRESDRAVRFNTQRALAPLEGLTIAVGWPPGLVRFPGPVTKAWRFVRSNTILVAPLLVLGFLFRLWRKKGRDPQGGGSVVVRYEPPEGLKPAELGTIVDEKVDLSDITATIVDLAVRRYLKIEVKEEKHLFGLFRKDEVVFHRRPHADPGRLRPHERTVLDGIFYGGRKSVEASDLAQRFYKHLPTIRKAIYGRLSEGGYFAGNPDSVRKSYVVIGVAAGIVVFGLGALWAVKTGAIMPYGMVISVFSAILTLILFLVFARAMPRKTRKGVTAYEWAKGFEEFVDRVESDRLEEDRKRNVFESLLPYAMALGVADKWARQFEGIYAEGREPPRWYIGSTPLHGGFSTSALQQSLAGSMTQAAQSLAASPRSSGSSGFGGGGGGGGGSSGGGGGGGGGGSW